MGKLSRAELASPLPGDEVVISGIAGYFPKSNSVKELQDNLFNKVDMLSDVNQSHEHSIKPKRMGKINNPTKFDQDFFDDDYTKSHGQNPMVRILLERTYEAIIDAGINPVELENTKTGVFVACTCSESEEKLLYDKVQENMNGIIGSSEAMLALRVSNWLKVTGPAYKLDSACSSSMHALEQAFKFLREDHLDYAIVAGVQLNMLNYTGDFDELCVLSEDGRCKSFDESADGFIRSEAIVACFLQKAKNSRRIYAQIIHSKTTNDGFKEEGLVRPSMKEQERLLREFYKECSVPTQNIEYMECHATGTPIGDFQELGALDAVLCSGRSEPLPIGSIRSNMGHAETAAALCSIAKLCIAYNTGYIAPNINFWKCRQDVPALVEGRLQVVTDKRPWNRGLAALNSFGFGGSNAHTLIKNIAKNKKDDGIPQDDLARLVCVSGRTHKAVSRILDSLEAKKVDVEEIRLWQAIHEHNIEKHIFRGYTLLESSHVGVSISKDIQRFCGVRRNICFLYSGVGSQWIRLAAQLMKLPLFADAISKCQEILLPKGVDLLNIINSNISEMTVINSSISTAAIQIALTSVLKTIEIEPDYVIGQGIGEIACAYADSALTMEQGILLAHYQAMMCTKILEIESKSTSAHVRKHPENISTETKTEPNTTPVKAISNGFNHSKVKEVKIKTQTNIDDIGLKLLNHLKKVLAPQPHSKRWIRTSTNADQQKISESRLSIAEYFAKNFMEPVSLDKLCQMIPVGCIHIDITPQTKFKTFIEDTQEDSVYIGLLSDSTKDGLEDFLKSLGKLYLVGCNPHVANLYPHVPFPVSQGTPMLSHLVEWDHREEWYTDPCVINKQMCKSVERVIAISVEKEGYLNGNIIDEHIVYPASGYLVLVWETLGLMMQRPYQDMSVVFEDIFFERRVIVPTTGQLEFIVTIHKVTGAFEVTENNCTVVTGHVRIKKDKCQDINEIDEANDIEEGSSDAVQYLQSTDIYNTLYLRGYKISGDFKRITQCNFEGTFFNIAWSDNWVVLLDSLLQTFNLKVYTSNIMLPTHIEKISIDVSTHYATLRTLADPKMMKAYGDIYINDVRSAGIEITAAQFMFIPKTPIPCVPVLETYEFFPFEENNPTKLDNALRATVQMIMENVQTYTFKAVEVMNDQYKRNQYEPIIHNIFDILQEQPLINAELNVITDELIEMPASVAVHNNIATYRNAILVIGANLCENSITLNQCWNILGDQGFVMSREPKSFQKSKYLNYNIISYSNIGTEYLVLLRKQKSTDIVNFVEMKTDDEYLWIDKVKEQLNKGGTFVVYSQDELCGLLGFINCLRREPDGENVRGFLIKDKSAPLFNPDLEFYKEQIKKNFTINIYENGKWGTYCHFLFKDLDQPVLLDNVYLNIATAGDLTSLKWTEGPLNVNCEKNTELLQINVYCSPLNSRDVMMAMGRKIMDEIPMPKLKQQDYLGIEFVGRSANGTRVMGMTEKALSNIILANPNLIMAIPDEWSFEEAATVFVAYFTVYAALVVYGKLKHGETVLIHAGTDDVGQAAINVCLSYGCEIFTTVDTAEKRIFIKKIFPKIKDSHISYSGDMSFEQMIQRETKGKGVDIVLNALPEEQLLTSARCLGYRGRFLDIGKFDIKNTCSIQMYLYEKEISFHGVILENIHQDKYAEMRQTILSLIANGISIGAVKPLTYCIFTKEEVKSAFTYVMDQLNIGKVIIKIREDEPRGTKLTNINAPLKMEGIRRYSCNPNNVYILVGGLGGFGLELADWLTSRGARKLLFVSRSGVTTGYQVMKIRKWKSFGVDVKTSTHDVTNENGCKEMLEMANLMGHVEAVFNLAMVPRNLTFELQTRDTFFVSCAPKATVAILLDKLTRILCPTLRDFVMFSSYICGRGNAGQTNYGFGNSVMERVCEKRRKDGLRALALQWGAVGDVGYLAREKIDQIKHVLTDQTIDSCLYYLDKFLKQDNTVVSSYLPSEKKIERNTVTDLQMQLDSIAKIMGIKDLKTISHQMTLAELGMDSIVAVELKNVLERNYDIFLSANETRALTFARLEELFASKQISFSTDIRESNVEVLLTLRLFMKFLGDESSAYKPCIFMPRYSKNDDGAICPNSENITFMVPGPAGCAATFESLSQKLKSTVCVLQLGLDYLDEDVTSMVDRLYQNLKLHLNPNTSFNLLGYSYGTVLVLELATRLEREGLKGTVFCIDGSPLWCNILINTEAARNNAAKLQNDLIGCVIDIAASGDRSNVMANIEEIQSFEEKIDYALQNLKVDSNYSKEYLKRTILTYYNQVNALRAFDTDSENKDKLESLLVLIRNKDDIFVSLSDSYSLEKYTKCSVAVHSINSDHVSIVEDEQCANIINGYLAVNNNEAKE